MKIIKFHQPERKVTIDQLRKLLNVKESEYTDEELKEILDFLYFLAELELQNYQKQNQDETEMHPLHSSKYRRAS